MYINGINHVFFSSATKMTSKVVADMGLNNPIPSIGDRLQVNDIDFL